jgi:hypothetical protein
MGATYSGADLACWLVSSSSWLHAPGVGEAVPPKTWWFLTTWLGVRVACGSPRRCGDSSGLVGSRHLFDPYLSGVNSANLNRGIAQALLNHVTPEG